MLGRSLSIREVDAGSCNGCEVEVNSLTNAIYDIERFGLHIVASPRHADMLLVTGPVTRNMEHALLQTYKATPSPKIVVAMGVLRHLRGHVPRYLCLMNGVDRSCRWMCTSPAARPAPRP